MSGQWEVVKGRNERRSKLPVPKTNGQQRPDSKSVKTTNLLNGVKIEEVLPKSQLQKLYLGKQSNKDNKVQEKSTKVHDNGKKPTKKPTTTNVTNNKPLEPPKPKLPKSIDSGLLAIDSEEFISLYKRCTETVPEAPIVWLKELTQFLNQKIPVDVQDPVFAKKPYKYPLSVVPSKIKQTIETAVREVGKSNAQLYFDIALISMVTDLSKGLPAVGYRFFLQHIAISEPKLVTEHLAKHISLRNSYQNRANVALSILWAVGHVGVNDLHCGLKVFEELMLPLLETKNYSEYVVKYLVDLIKQKREDSLSKEEYCFILDTIFANRKNFPSHLRQKLIGILPKVRDLYLNNKKKDNFLQVLEQFLKKINQTNDPIYRDALSATIVEFFAKDQTALTYWSRIYGKNLLASAIVLTYISNNYDSIRQNLRKPLKDLFVKFATINQELSLNKKKKDEGLKEAILAVKKAQESKQRKTVDRPKGLFGILIYFIWIVILLEPLYRPDKATEDLYMFSIGRFIGKAFEYLWLRLDVALEEYVPNPYLVVREFGVPYAILIQDIFKTSLNFFDYVRELYLEAVKEYVPHVVKFMNVLLTYIVQTFGRISDYLFEVIAYLKREVFTQEMCENLQKTFWSAYNVTIEKTTYFYKTASEKVQDYIK
ncbi:hypothetical protein ABEB36_007180 [Hypothenemus hampei]|uniref:Uncharacterized protein n=1 Tax=Hypothenemus hampei TaxID=57062 RepID=A0ABD1EW63_HYPHA